MNTRASIEIPQRFKLETRALRVHPENNKRLGMTIRNLKPASVYTKAHTRASNFLRTLSRVPITPSCLDLDKNQNPTFSKIAVSYTCFTGETAWGEGLGIWVSTYDLWPRILSGEWLKWDGSMGLDGESFIGYSDDLDRNHVSKLCFW